MSKHTSLALACLLSLSLGVPAFRNGVGQLPVMGWSGYLAFMQNSGHCDQAGASGYNETTFVQTMDALRATGLADAGYVYLNADDCWIAENRTQDGRLTHDTSRFPHGMAWLADQAHSRALKLGLCKPASNATPEASRDGIRTRGHEAVDAATFAEWGADFAKLDSCGGVLNNGTESWDEQYSKWSAALNASGRQIVFSCSWAVYFTECAGKHAPESWEAECGTVPWQNRHIGNICHMWRYGDDLFPTWGTGDGTPMNGGGGGGVGDVIEFASSFWASSWRLAAGAGAFLDPDFLAVGCPTDRPCEAGTPRPRGPPLSDVEQRTQMTMWCVLGAPLIIGADVRNLSSMALATLSSKEAILVNQDPLVAQPRLISKRPLPAVGTQVWARHLANGDTAVAMVNMHPKATRTVEIDLRDIASCPSCHAPEFAWTNIWTGDTGKASSTFSASVAPHAAVFLRLKPQATQTV